MVSGLTGRRNERAGRVVLGLATAVALLALAACQGTSRPSTVSSGGKSAALRAMEPVAIAAYRCWFGTRDAAFRTYRFANELNSMTGQPRFLLVPSKNFGGLPALVVQARGASSSVESFGPALDGPLGARIRADLARWSAGDAACTAGA